MLQNIQNTLQEVIDLLLQIDNIVYTQKNQTLSDATIGQHTRHIIELFECLLLQYDQNKVNYEDRKREKSIENEKNIAIEKLIWIQNNIEKPDKNIDMVCSFNNRKYTIISNYYRELIYNLEHCIHHQALIKVALINNEKISIDANFGVAPSTIRYRNLCVQ